MPVVCQRRPSAPTSGRRLPVLWDLRSFTTADSEKKQSDAGPLNAIFSHRSRSGFRTTIRGLASVVECDRMRMIFDAGKVTVR